jgi:hypothetical protein
MSYVNKEKGLKNRELEKQVLYLRGFSFEVYPLKIMPFNITNSLYIYYI